MNKKEKKALEQKVYFHLVCGNTIMLMLNDFHKLGYLSEKGEEIFNQLKKKDFSNLVNEIIHPIGYLILDINDGHMEIIDFSEIEDILKSGDNIAIFPKNI